MATARIRPRPPAPRRRATALALAGAALLVCVAATGSASAEERRVALVIGNARYDTLPELDNPTNDVDGVAAVLRDAGFDVIVGRDLDRVGMETLIGRFFRSFDEDDVALFYYSGHGVQLAGENYIIPVDATLASAYDIETQTMSLGYVLNYMRQHSATQLVFLDACRDNPFGAGAYWVADRMVTANAATGLASIRPAVGTLIAFATEPGSVSYDGAGSMSPFSEAFVRRALAPNEEIRSMLTLVRRDVVAATGGLQVPWENSALVQDFYLVPLRPPPSVPAMTRVTINPGGAVPLGLPEPEVVGAADLTVSFDLLPGIGRVTVDGAPVEVGRQYPVAVLHQARFETATDRAGMTDVIGYTVTDDIGQSARGIVALTVAAPLEMADGRDFGAAEGIMPGGARNGGGNGAATTAPAPAPEPAPPAPGLAFGAPPVGGAPPDAFALEDGEQIAMAVAAGPDNWTEVLTAAGNALSAQTIDVTIGVGPVPLRLPDNLLTFEVASLGTMAQPQLRLVEGPDAGIVRLGAEEITEGAVISGARVGELSFEPQIGTEGEAQSIRFEVFAPSDLPSQSATLTLEPVIDACDAEAGEPLDLQGVTSGVLPNAIDVRAALIACGRAMKLHPGVARFVYEYGRAQFAAADNGAAFATFRRAAELGHIRALNQLGFMVALGAGAPEDPVLANRYYAECADLGDPYGLLAFGRALYYGLGVPMDRTRGLELMVQAAQLGHTYAMNELGSIFLNGVGIEADPERGLAFYREGVRRGDIYSMNNLANAYLRGNGVAQDNAEALRLFSQASAGGHPAAAMYLGIIYRDGRGVPVDLSRAAGLFELAAERGSVYGALYRGDLAAAASGPASAVLAARYYALAAALDTGGAETSAETKLAALSDTVRSAALAEIAQQLGEAPATAGALDARLIEAARRLWQRENPRLDMF